MRVAVDNKKAVRRMREKVEDLLENVAFIYKGSRCSFIGLLSTDIFHRTRPPARALTFTRASSRSSRACGSTTRAMRASSIRISLSLVFRFQQLHLLSLWYVVVLLKSLNVDDQLRGCFRRLKTFLMSSRPVSTSSVPSPRPTTGPNTSSTWMSSSDGLRRIQTLSRSGSESCSPSHGAVHCSIAIYIISDYFCVEPGSVLSREDLRIGFQLLT